MTPRFFLYLCLLFVIAVYGFLNIKKSSFSFKVLTILVALSLISETLSGNGLRLITNQILVYHLLLPITMLLLFLIYSQLPNNYRKVDAFITLVCVLMSIVNSIFFQNEKNIFPSIGASLLCNLAIWLSLQTFKQMIILPTSVSILKRPEFWLSSSTLFFYTVTFFTLTFYNDYGELLWIDDITYFSNFVLYPGYFFALVLDLKNKIPYAPIES